MVIVTFFFTSHVQLQRDRHGTGCRVEFNSFGALSGEFIVHDPFESDSASVITSSRVSEGAFHQDNMLMLKRVSLKDVFIRCF